jgi:tetratricopeptide (TPR) repeat protein
LALLLGLLWLTVGRTVRLQIVEFGTDTLAAEPLQPAVLKWRVSGAETCRIAPGIGEVPAVGTMTVRPGTSTTYTLHAAGHGQSLSADVTVSVAKPTPSVVPSKQVDTSLAKARDFFNRGAYDRSIAAYDTALAADSGNRQAQAGLAEARAAREAERRLSAGAGKRGEDTLRKAQRLYNNGEYEAAIAAFEQALTANPRSDSARSGLAAAKAAAEAEKRVQ